MVGAAALFVILVISSVVLSLFLVRTIRAETLASERLDEAQRAGEVSETVTGFLVRVLSSVSRLSRRPR